MQPSPQTNLTAPRDRRRAGRSLSFWCGSGVRSEMNRKIARYLAERPADTPCLVVDLDVIAQNYKRLAKALPLARIYYAVKANPAAPILGVLRDLGSSFDTASIYEIDHCLGIGIAPE